MANSDESLSTSAARSEAPQDRDQIFLSQPQLRTQSARFGIKFLDLLCVGGDQISGLTFLVNMMYPDIWTIE